MKKYIETLINKLFTDPSETLYNSILKEYIGSHEFTPYEDLDECRQHLDKYISENDHASVIKTCYEILKIKPFDLEAHILTSRFAANLNKFSLASLHEYIANLRKSDLCRNSGKSLKEAIKIIYPEDELFYFKINQLQPSKRISHEKDERFFDIYSFETRSDLFFDITIPFLKAASDNDTY